MAKESGGDRRSGRDHGSGRDHDSGGNVGRGGDRDSGSDLDPEEDRDSDGDRDSGRDVDSDGDRDSGKDVGPGRDRRSGRDLDPGGNRDTGRDRRSGRHLDPDGDREPVRDFDAFYQATHRRTVGQVYAMCGNLHEAEDCVQEAFARAWQRWPALSSAGLSGDPEAWVRTVAVRLAVSSWRKAVNRLVAHRREAGATGVPGMNPDHVAVVTALRRISADQRLAIVLQHYGGLSVEEIAAQTGASPSAVKARLARGRAALAPHLTEFAQSLGEARRPPSRDPSEFSPGPSKSRTRSRSRQEI